jgi:DNA invertase Pin-like site-specific DNA recombinase
MKARIAARLASRRISPASPAQRPKGGLVRCFAYLRVSSRGQVDGDGFARQRQAIEAYAAAHGLHIVRWFIEEGVSGTTESMHRPAWLELMEALLANGVRTVVVEKLDRLARDYMIQEMVIRDFQKRGFTILSTCEPAIMDDPTDPTRRLVRTIMGAIAEYDKTMTVLKLRGARLRRRAAEGHCEGRKPFGTRPGETETLSLMLALRKQGLSYAAIAAELNHQQRPSREGRPWTHGTVGPVLSHAAHRAKR